MNNIAPLLKFTIGLNPVTKKNHMEIRYKKKKSPARSKSMRLFDKFVAEYYPFPSPSKVYKDYEENAGWFLKSVQGKNIDIRVNVKATYYMKTLGTVDLPNLHSALHDVLKKYEVVKDDNSKIIVATDGSRVKYDKNNPRTEVEIMEIFDEVEE